MRRITPSYNIARSSPAKDPGLVFWYKDSHMSNRVFTGDFTVDATTNIATSANHPFGNPYNENSGISILVTLTSTGTLPGGLSSNTVYVVNAIDATTFKFYPTGPTYIADNASRLNNTIDITSTGSGTHTFSTQPMAMQLTDLSGRGHRLINGDGSLTSMRSSHIYKALPGSTMPGLYSPGFQSAASDGNSNNKTFASTNVNVSNDTITLTAHGFSTGLGITLGSVLGGTPPGGCSYFTIYYLKSVDANTLQLYDTRANALVGGATGLINITSQGSGTHAIGLDIGEGVYYDPQNDDARYTMNAEIKGQRGSTYFVISKRQFQLANIQDTKFRDLTILNASGGSRFSPEYRPFMGSMPVVQIRSWDATQVDVSTDIFTVPDHGFTRGSKIRVSIDSGSLPSGINSSFLCKFNGASSGVVDITNDIITVTAHGINTGTQVRLDALGGSLPTGLSTATDYWIRALDTNTFSLYTSLANANSDTSRVNITALGNAMCQVITYYWVRTLSKDTFSLHTTSAGSTSTSSDSISKLDITSLGSGMMTLTTSNAFRQFVSLDATSASIISTSTGNISFSSHGLSQGLAVSIKGRNGSPPTGYTEGVTYYVRVVSNNIFILYDTFTNANASDTTPGVAPSTGKIVPSALGTATDCLFYNETPGWSPGLSAERPTNSQGTTPDPGRFTAKRLNNINSWNVTVYQIDYNDPTQDQPSAWCWVNMGQRLALIQGSNTLNPTGMTFTKGDGTFPATNSSSPGAHLFNSGQGDTPAIGLIKEAFLINRVLTQAEITQYIHYFHTQYPFLDIGCY
jgi:hypothetical protein